MAENVQVASLTAPITVKIPTDTLNKFQRQLEGIADTLEFIVEQLKDVSKEAKRSFKGVGKSLKVQNITQNKFIDGQKQIHQNQKKTRSNAKRTSKIFGSWADKLAQVRVGLGLVRFALGKVVQLLAIPAGVFAGFTFLAAKTNKITSEMSRLSEAVGFSLNGMTALAMEAQGLGFTFEHVNSLVEELNNKLGGEAGGFIEQNLQEGLASLNVEARELQKLSPEEQIAKIMNASQDLLKKGRTAELSSAFDKIFGQEGNRLLTAFAQKMEITGRTYEEIIGFNQRISGISGEAEAGARSFTGFFQTLTTSIKSVGAELFGKFGKRLEPFFKGMMPLFLDLPELLSKKLSPALDVLAAKFTKAFGRVLEIVRDLLEDPDKLIEMIDNITDGLQRMWDVGIGLSKMIFGLLEFIATDSALRSLIAWLGTIIASVAIATLFFAKLKTAVIAVASSIVGFAAAKATLVAFGAATVAAFSPILIVLAQVAAALGVVYGAYKATTALLDTKAGNKFTDFLADNLFGADVDQASQDPRAAAAVALRKRNMARLSAGESVQSNVNRSNNSTVNNVNNTIVVNDPETGTAIKEEVFNPGRPQ